MPRLTDLLDEAVGEVDVSFGLAEIEERVADCRRRRTWAARGAMALVVALVASAVVAVATRDDDNVSVGSPNGLFPDRTGMVLVLDDGYDGVVLFDIDRKRAVRRVIDGQGAGDAPYRIMLIDNTFVVGWGEVWAVPLDGQSSRLLGHGTISLPAAEPHHVWLVDFPGGRIGEGRPTVRLVDLDGRVALEREGLDPAAEPHFNAAMGIPGGLAYQSRDGLVLWDATTGRVTGRLGRGSVFPGPIHRERLAWCDDECRRLQVTDLGDRQLPTVGVPVPDGTRQFAIDSAQFAPDGKRIAVVANDRIVVVDVATGAARLVPFEAPSERISVAWSPDGSEVFFVVVADDRTGEIPTIGRYVLADDRVDAASVSFPSPVVAPLVVAVERERVERLLAAPLVEPDACPPPTMFPSGRTEPCAFDPTAEPAH